MTWRMRSVRKRILLLALVPLLSLFGLYVFATSITARNAINLARADTLKNATGQPTGTFEGQLQAERLRAMLYLAAPTPQNQARLAGIEQVTGHQAAALRGTLTSGATMNNASAPQARAIDTLLAGIKTLPALLAQEAAILLGDMSTGSFPPADRRQFAQLVGARRNLTEVTLPDLDQPYRGYYTRDVSPLA